MKKLSGQTVFTGRAFAVRQDLLELPSGKRIQREVVVHPGAVVILPVLSNGKVLLIRQFRYAIGEDLLEFPAGTLNSKEVPAACALRELMEETGYGAKKWRDLGILYPAPGFCDEKQYLYEATELYAERLQADEDEIIETVEMGLEEVEAAIAAGTIRDGKSISIFMRWRLKSRA